MENPRANTKERLHELDSLRGIAACVVVLGHLRYMFYTSPPRWYLRPLFDGQAAVVLFFTLSGFVLSIAFWQGRRFVYTSFLIRRFFRIYVPYALACLLAVLVARPLLFARLPLTSWFYQTWHTPMTFALVAGQLLRMKNTPEINTAFWSLRYEVEMSIIFPALCILLQKLKLLSSVALGLLSVLFGYFLFAHGTSPRAIEAGSTLLWGSCFIFGALLAWYRTEISSVYSTTSQHLRVAVFLAALCGYLSYNVLAIIPSTCLLIIFAKEGWLKDKLNNPLPEYLGKISYSLYLLHGTVLFASMILLYGRIPFPLIAIIYLTVSFAAAHLFNFIIEEPADRLGKRLTTRGLVVKRGSGVPV